MVETVLINRILQRLERFLVRKNGFQLKGDVYDLILLIPSDKYISEGKYSLVISYKKLDELNQKDVIRELLSDFKGILKLDEYNAISRLNIVHSEDALVKNLKTLFAFREQTIEINNIPVGGVNIDFAYIIKSLVLDKLKENQAVILDVINQEGILQTINAGIIKIDENYDVFYYTGKGLREIFKPDMTEEQREIAETLKQRTEQDLIDNGYIGVINLENIVKVQ